MSQAFPSLLETVDVLPPLEAAGLQVFGLRWQLPAGPAYVTLDDALAAQTLDVTEVGANGSVPTLQVINKGDTLVFLMAGEQLAGAKQNRVLNTSILVKERSELPIPVSCVEAGRWAYRSAKFASAGTSSHSNLRRLMTGHVSASYRRDQKPRSDQTAVWAEVSRKLDTMNSVSETMCLAQAYDDHRPKLEAVAKDLPVPADCHGVAFARDGKVLEVDLFDRPATLAKLWPKLVRAQALDALEAAAAAPVRLEPAAVKAWLLAIPRAKAEAFPSPGLGQDWRLEGAGVVGHALVVEDHPVHVEVFATTA